jgi:hypothetical protein
MEPQLPVLYPLRVQGSLLSQAASSLTSAGPDIVSELAEDPNCASALGSDLQASVEALVSVSASLAALRASAEEVVNASAPD